MKLSRSKIIIIGAVILVLVISIPIIVYNSKKTENKYEFNITTEESPNCSGIYELAFELSKKNVYAYCFDSIKISDKDLKDYLQEERTSGLNKIIKNMTLTEQLRDGGSKVYTSEDNFTNNGLKVIMCDTKKGDQSIYFGPLSMPNNLCK